MGVSRWASGALSCATPVTGSVSTTTSDRSGGPGTPCPTPRWCAGSWPGDPSDRGGRGVEGQGGGTVLGHSHPGQGRIGWHTEEIVSASCVSTGMKHAWRLDIAARVRHDACMDSRALERLGHHVVSRRVALGFRNRTDLAASLQLTVRTLADIEHGVRKASPGTYAMLENKLAWAPGSIDTIMAEANQPRWRPHCTRASPPPGRRDTHRARPPPMAYRRRPPRNCCSNCDDASSPPGPDAMKPGTTGTAALTRTATGPRRVSSAGRATSSRWVPPNATSICSNGRGSSGREMIPLIDERRNARNATDMFSVS